MNFTINHSIWIIIHNSDIIGYNMHFCWTHYFYLSHLQVQRVVHFRPSFTHLHLVHFPERPHIIRFLQALLASGSVVHSGSQLAFSFFHPQFSGLCWVGLDSGNWPKPHVWPPVYVALRVFCLIAACVGGILSRALPCITRWTLASFLGKFHLFYHIIVQQIFQSYLDSDLECDEDCLIA